MVDLIAKTPADGVLPVSHGALRLRELSHGAITSLAPYKGKEKTVSAALKKSIGAGLPEIGRLIAGEKGDILWVGRGEYFVLGERPGKTGAALTDQSDAWCCVALEGAGASDVLARICPLNGAGMDEGDVARSLIGHMMAIVIKRSDGFDLMVFRAFAKTLTHEVEQAMKSVAAQGRILS